MWMSRKDRVRASTAFSIAVPRAETYGPTAQAHLEECAATIPSLLDSAQIPSEVRPLYEDWWANTREDIRNVTTRIEAITNIWSHVCRSSVPPRNRSPSANENAD